MHTPNHADNKNPSESFTFSIHWGDSSEDFDASDAADLITSLRRTIGALPPSDTRGRLEQLLARLDNLFSNGIKAWGLN